MDFQAEQFCQVSPHAAVRDLEKEKRPLCQNLPGEVKGINPRDLGKGGHGWLDLLLQRNVPSAKTQDSAPKRHGKCTACAGERARALMDGFVGPWPHGLGGLDVAVEVLFVLPATKAFLKT